MDFYLKAFNFLIYPSILGTLFSLVFYLALFQYLEHIRIEYHTNAKRP